MSRFDFVALACIVLFLLLFLGRTLQMILLLKINPFVLGVNKPGVDKFLEWSLLIGFVTWLFEAFASIFKFQNFLPDFLSTVVFQNDLLKCIGCTLMSMGLCIFLFTLVSFGTSWRIGIDNKTPGKLITNGVFSFSRNPIFLFIDFFVVGFGFVYPTMFFFVFTIITILCIHYQIMKEEDFLNQQYGAEYQAYKARVRRYL